MTDSSSLSRAEYLKRYMSDGGGEKKKKKNKTAKEVKTNGMRLLDEDTFLPSRAQTSKSKPKNPESSDFEDEEDDEEVDDIERTVRAMNRKCKMGKKNEDKGPGFKTDSFITVEGGDASEEEVKPEIPSSSSSSSAIAKEEEKSTKKRRRKESAKQQQIKEEAQSEDEEQPQTVQKRPRMDGGGQAGLLTKETMLREEQEQRERDLQRLRDMESEGAQDNSGRFAETRKRETRFERKGRNARDAPPEDEAKKAREAQKQAELAEKYKLWNRGVTQIKEREDKLEEMAEVVGEGFARYADDEAMNQHMKDQLHKEDPMADYFKLKTHKVQMRTGVVYPTYQGQCPPNRYGIPPGYRWDGVDRSNGFESKLQLERNKRKAREEQTYRLIAECEE